MYTEVFLKKINSALLLYNTPSYILSLHFPLRCLIKISYSAYTVTLHCKLSIETDSSRCLFQPPSLGVKKEGVSPLCAAWASFESLRTTHRLVVAHQEQHLDHTAEEAKPLLSQSVPKQGFSPHICVFCSGISGTCSSQQILKSDCSNRRGWDRSYSLLFSASPSSLQLSVP